MQPLSTLWVAPRFIEATGERELGSGEDWKQTSTSRSIKSIRANLVWRSPSLGERLSSRLQYRHAVSAQASSGGRLAMEDNRVFDPAYRLRRQRRVVLSTA